MNPDNRVSDIALVVQGGGTRAAFGAGVLDAIAERGICFPYVIGTSAGALLSVNFISKDIGRSKFIFTELMGDSKFISLHNLLHLHSVFNFDYLFYDVPKEKSPWNEKGFWADSNLFYVAATGMKDGKAHYFEHRGIKDFYPALAASASLPLLSKPVMVEGEPYLDGGPAASIPFRKPLQDGYRKLVIVETRHKEFRKKRISKRSKALAGHFYKEYPEFLKTYAKTAEIYNRDVEEIESLERDGIAFVIRPQIPLTIGHTETNPKTLMEVYDLGRSEAERIMPDLLAFLGMNHEQKR